MNHATVHEVLAEIDTFFGRTLAPSPATVGTRTTATAAAAGPRNAATLHLMYDTERKALIGCSVGGKVITGAVAAHITKDGVSLLDAEGENLLGANAGVAKHRSKADVSSQVARDIYNLLTGREDEGWPGRTRQSI